MITQDAIGTLSYFARMIYDVVGTGQENPGAEKGEAIEVIGARETDVDGPADDPNRLSVLSHLKSNSEGFENLISL